jgi:selenide,water dikinase
VPHVEDPRVLIDAATRDDAAVFQLTEDRALVASVDFFAPIVDDPYKFGSIAATNAFSDLYAMGATPLLALNLVAWPRDPAILALLGETLRGGADTAREAGAFILGGHSIDDKEPKYGMVTIGEVHPARVISNARAQAGDALVLTKPIGTGVLSTALKRGSLTESDIDAAVSSMATLNAGAAHAMRDVGDAVHAATDVTGFGLLGHLRALLEASGQSARLAVSDIPVFPHVRESIANDAIPGGTERNLESVDADVTWESGVTQADKLLLADAQTSGGLLISVDGSRVDDLLAALRSRQTPAASKIGHVLPREDELIRVTERGD